MNSKFKKIFASFMLGLMVLLIPVEVFAQEKIQPKESTKQEAIQKSERGSRQKRGINVKEDDRYHDDGYGEGTLPRNMKLINDSWLKRNGVDAHQLKREVIGRRAPISQYDIYTDKDTGRLWVFKKGDVGEGFPSDEYIK